MSTLHTYILSMLCLSFFAAFPILAVLLFPLTFTAFMYAMTSWTDLAIELAL